MSFLELLGIVVENDCPAEYMPKRFEAWQDNKLWKVDYAVVYGDGSVQEDSFTAEARVLSEMAAKAETMLEAVAKTVGCIHWTILSIINVKKELF